MRSVRLAFLLVGVVLTVGTIGYMALEDWGPLDALWMVAISLTTIGYGEVHALSDAGRVFTLLIIVVWFGLGTFALSRVTQALVSGDLRQTIQRRAKERILKKLRDHFIVVGYGRLGRAVADELLLMDTEVCVVERDAGVVERLEKQGDFPVVQGEGADDNALVSAGIERALGMAITLPSAAEAVYVSMAAKQLNPRLRVVTRIAGLEATMRARRVGADQVVSPFRIGGWRMAHGLVRPAASTFLDLATMASHDEINLDEVPIPEGSLFADRTLGELQVGSSHGLLVVGVRRPDGTMVATPGASQRLEQGDVVIVIGKPDRLIQFSKAATEGTR